MAARHSAAIQGPWIATACGLAMTPPSGFIRIRKALRDYPEIDFEIKEFAGGVMATFAQRGASGGVNVGVNVGASGGVNGGANGGVNGGANGGVNGGANGLLSYIQSHPGNAQVKWR